MALLVEHGADPCAADLSGITPLMLAASRDRIDTVQWLVEHGADVDAVDRTKGWSVVGHAARGGAVLVLEYLLTLRPRMLSAPHHGGNVVEAAVEGLSAQALAFLLPRGASADKARLLAVLDDVEFDRPSPLARECRAVLERCLPG